MFRLVYTRIYVQFVLNYSQFVIHLLAMALYSSKFHLWTLEVGSTPKTTKRETTVSCALTTKLVSIRRNTPLL